jgi:ABC-type cobalamin/Fe3+-siderophores transport system ATPase subunit
MFFTIVNKFGQYPAGTRSKVFLTWDDWNDYSYNTLFGIIYVDKNAVKHDLGGIKIAHFDQQEKERRLKIGDQFDNIAPEYFSVGLDDEYYVKLNGLGDTIRDRILKGLNDIAKDDITYKKAEYEEVFKVSFLRGLSETTITGQFRRLTMGLVRLTPYDFVYSSPDGPENAPLSLSFNVQPLSNPPTNIHILIGRNGVGKTYVINNMIDCLTKPDSEVEKFGMFVSNLEEEEELFANLICVSFSAFDDFEHPPEVRDKSTGIQYSYIGLKSVQTADTVSQVKKPLILSREFTKSLVACINSKKTKRWIDAIQMLETDPIFRSADIPALININTEGGLTAASERVFKTLSSGHKIVLLTITRLVETLQERSLVLLDEPESHLHPPLLSSFMRVLSELMTDRNAVSIIATHSPVVLQEVPRSCVWKLRKNGDESNCDRPQIESFGENVGVLTEEVFGLEVTDSGFHRILKDLVKNFSFYEDAISSIDGQLGLEAKAILRGLFYKKDNSND